MFIIIKKTKQLLSSKTHMNKYSRKKRDRKKTNPIMHKIKEELYFFTNITYKYNIILKRSGSFETALIAYRSASFSFEFFILTVILIK